MASATTFSFLVPQGEDEYPSLRGLSSRSSQRMSLVTLACTASFSLVVSVFVGTVCFVRNPVARDSEERYGLKRCAEGSDMFSEPVVNYSPCCTQYASSCCELHDGCIRQHQYPGWHCPDDRGAVACGMLPRKPSPTCMELMNLISCARCSPFGGNFVKGGAHFNVTVCVTLCRQLWGACGMATERGSALDFCASLGLHVALTDSSSPSEPCFSSAGTIHHSAKLLSLVLVVYTLRTAWA